MIDKRDSVFTNNEIYIVYSNPGTAPIYDYPTNINKNEYPKINDLKLKWNNNFEAWHEEDRFPSLSNVKEIKTKSDFYQDFEYLIITQDPDHVGAFYAKSLLETVYSNNYESNFKKVIYTKIVSLENISKNFYKKQEEKKKEFEKMAQAGRVKKWFQYNFNINSKIFFGELLDVLKIETTKNLSKYMLQIIHILNNPMYTRLFKITRETYYVSGIKEYNLYSAMSDYEGSGKLKADMYKCGLGTVATRGTIIENFKDMNLMMIQGGVCYPTTKSKKLFSLLDDSTFDIDMSYKIENWLDKAYEGEDVINEMEKYICNIFKGQKRKNDLQLKKESVEII